MTRPLARRLVPVAVAGACLAATALPAAAEHGPADSTTHDLQVQATAVAGTRHFHVYDTALDQAPGRLVFGPAGEQPFRVVVEDVDHHVQAAGFDVTTKMTNLHWFDPHREALDPDVIIPSRNLGLAYDSRNPLDATGLTFPVRPSVDITGTLPSCTDAGLAGALGIDLNGPLGIPLPLGDLIGNLTGAQKTLCQALRDVGAQGAVALQHTEEPVDLALGSVTTLAGLADLPVALAGGQQSGAFTNPAYKAFPRPAGTPDATVKRVMSGRPHSSATLLAQLQTVLTGTVTDVYGTANSLVSEADVITTIGGLDPRLVSSLQLLPTSTDVNAVVDQLVGALRVALRPLDQAALSTLRGRYTARPVLLANTAAARPGVYEGTLTVDFVDGVR